MLCECYVTELGAPQIAVHFQW